MNVVMYLIRGSVGVAKKEPVRAGRHVPGQDVGEVKAFLIPLEIEADRISEGKVIIAQNNGQPGIDRAQLVENRFLTDVAEMPDFIDVPEQLRDPRNPTIVGVGDDTDAVAGVNAHDAQA